MVAHEPVLVAEVLAIVRERAGSELQPTLVRIDSGTVQRTPKLVARAGHDEAKRRKGSKVHIAVDTLGHLLALKVTAASEGGRKQLAVLAKEVQRGTGHTAGLACVDKATTVPTPPKLPHSTVSGRRLSNTPSPNVALCCCRADG